MPSTRLVPGGQRVGQNVWQVSPQPTRELAQRLDPAAHGALVRVLPEPLGVAQMPVVPQSLEVVFENAECHQRLVRREDLFEPNLVCFSRDILEIAQ